MILSRQRLRAIYQGHRARFPDLHKSADSVRTQYQGHETEFATALHTYKIECRRPHPTFSEVLAILFELGYRRPARWEVQTSTPNRGARGEGRGARVWKAEELTRPELHAALLWILDQVERTCIVPDSQDLAGINAHLRAAWGARDAINELFSNEV
jgi:hypothetical protein